MDEGVHQYNRDDDVLWQYGTYWRQWVYDPSEGGFVSRASWRDDERHILSSSQSHLATALLHGDEGAAVITDGDLVERLSSAGWCLFEAFETDLNDGGSAGYRLEMKFRRRQGEAGVGTCVQTA